MQFFGYCQEKIIGKEEIVREKGQYLSLKLQVSLHYIKELKEHPRF